MRIRKGMKITIGSKSKIDKTVIVGEKTGRKIKSGKLYIGKNAKIRSNSVIYEGSKIGNNLETGHNVLIREENVIGNHFSIWTNSIIDYGCKIGNNVKIQSNCYISQFTVIEDDVFLGPGIVIANDRYPVSPATPKYLKGPIIKKGAKIGANVTLLPGVTIGEYSLIGGGAVVANDIPPGSVAYGNPAIAKKTINQLIDPYSKKKAYAKILPKLKKVLKKK